VIFLEDKYLTITQLNRYIKFKIDQDVNLNSVFLKGEISNFKAHTRGHLYFTLKDENSRINAVMFQGNAKNLKFVPVDGMKVLLVGKVSVYESSGSYQIYVQEMLEDGVGNLALEFEKLKKKLASEGLFDPSHKRKIPRIPKRVGVVTASTGAAIKDILTTIKRRWPITEVILFPSLVQGASASSDIVRQITTAQNYNLDTLIVGRGGGSIEDLWCFNEEAVARAVFNSEVPVISAVGHETDYTISDFVADLRAPTPSAAAELCVPDLSDFEEYLYMCEKRLKTALFATVERNRQKLEFYRAKNVFKYPERMFEKQNQDVMENSSRLINSFKDIFSENKERFIKNVSKLDGLSPLKVLKRGYSFVEDENGKVIDSVEKVELDKKIKLKFSDGAAECKVINKEALS